MCGIFGFQTNNLKIIKNLTISFLKLSEDRGKEASGICSNYENEFDILKKPCSGSDLSKTKDFSEFFNKFDLNKNEQSYFSLIGQCRLATDGQSYIEDYNHPAIHNNISLVHNGIILNTEEILNSQANYNSKNENFQSIINQSDTFNFAKIINNFKTDYKNEFNNLNKSLSGSYSIGFFDKRYKSLFITSNNQSLFYLLDNDIFIFASEKNTIQKIIKKFKFNNKEKIKQIIPNQFIEINKLKLDNEKYESIPTKSNYNVNYASTFSEKNLCRCKRCILPNTYPFITFDKNGICNFCLDYDKLIIKKKDNLNFLLDKHRSNNNNPDCIVGLSGGRDSCYGLHILKNELGMNPIAYTYDWGLTTTVSRRNQALMIGKLGIEHIIRSPRIDIKRENIRKNIHAWLKKPNLGMVPLFMAGDKDFYKYGRKLKKQLGIDLTVFCSGQHYEQGNFFIGFCGIKEDMSYKTARAYDFPIDIKLKLAIFYITQYLKNPSYINQSFIDSIMSFITMFLAKDDFLYLYEFIDWDEKLINKTLNDQYGWESDRKYGSNQWRMGDGQTAFTNYIYYRLAGFSEFDDFRSKQIRDKKITRDEALELVQKDNQPKFEVLEEFASIIGINLEHVLSRINTIDRIY